MRGSREDGQTNRQRLSMPEARRRISEPTDAIAVSASDDGGEGRRPFWRCQSLHLSDTRSRPEDPGRRVATQSLLMVAATAVAAVVAGIVGTFLQFVVFDLEEQELLPEAGVWGYLAGLFLLALMVLPAVVGVVLGVRARRLGEESAPAQRREERPERTL